MTLNKADVRTRIAALLKENMDIDPVLALQDTVFTELHNDFDSLALLELQLLLEKEFSMEFNGVDRNAKMPTNVSEMADALMREYELYHQRQAKEKAKSAAKAAESVTN